MQHDDLIWRSVDQGFCSYKVKTVKQNFCRNKYNITERAHSPRNLWQKIKLSKNYKHALQQIDRHLEYWPEFYIHKAKQRLTKMVQYHIRRRRIALRTKTRLVGIKKKVERREKSREVKAVAAAKLDKAIEKELLERLRSGAYGDIYNFPQEQYEKVLEDEEEAEENSEEELYEDEYSDEFEADYEYEDEDEDEDEQIETLVDVENDVEDSGMLKASRAAPQFDFDDYSDDDDADHDAADSQDPMARVRARAKRRHSSDKNVGQTKGRKGRSLRRPRDSRGVQMEMEYEHERDTSIAKR